MVAPDEFGVPEDKRRAQGEGDQQNQDDCLQAAIGNGFPLPGGGDLFRAVLASVQESMLEGPMLGEVHPTVVLLLPAAVPQLVNDPGGKGLLRERGDPKPLLISGLQSAFPLAVAVALQHLFGAHHPHRSRMVDGKRQAFGIPKLDLVGPMVALLGEGQVWRPLRKQAHRRLIQIP